MDCGTPGFLVHHQLVELGLLNTLQVPEVPTAEISFPPKWPWRGLFTVWTAAERSDSPPPSPTPGSQRRTHRSCLIPLQDYGTEEGSGLQALSGLSVLDYIFQKPAGVTSLPTKVSALNQLSRPCGVARAECETTWSAGILQDAGEAEDEELSEPRCRDRPCLEPQALARARSCVGVCVCNVMCLWDCMILCVNTCESDNCVFSEWPGKETCL